MRLTGIPTWKNIVAVVMTKHAVFSSLFAILIWAFVFAATASSTMPAWVDGTPEMLSLTRELLTNPAVMPAPAKTAKVIYKPVMGSRRNFYAFDFDAGYRQYSVPATCRAVGAHCYIFVEDAVWNLWVTASDVEALRAAFDEKTPEQQHKGIYAIETTSLGPLPDIDRDTKIYLLILDIRDGFPRGGGSYVAGYFSPLDQNVGGFSYHNETFYSNEAELIYLDAYPLDTGSLFAQGVLAHECQHLIHWNIDPNEELWINEGASEYAMFLCGYPPTEHVRDFEQRPNVSLVDWSGELANYGAAYLWFLHLHERYGSAFISALINNRAHGIEGIDSTLENLENYETFDQIFCDWKIANLLDNTSLAGCKYGYETVQVNVDISNQHSSYPVSASGNLNRWAADYLKLMLPQNKRANFGNASLEVNFSCTPAANFDVHLVSVKNGKPLDIYAMEIDPSTGRGEIILRSSIGMDEVVLIPSWQSQSSRRDDSREYSYSACLIDSFVATGREVEKRRKPKYEEAIHNSSLIVHNYITPSVIKQLLISKEENTMFKKVSTQRKESAMFSYSTLILTLVSTLILLWSSSLGSVVAAELILLGTDPDDGLAVDLFKIYAQVDGEFLRLKVSSYNDWGNPAKDMYVVAHINSDLDWRTGDPEDEGTDYIIHVGSYKGSFAVALWKFEERPNPATRRAKHSNNRV